MLSRILKASALAAVLAAPAYANDGFGGLTTGGLEFLSSPVRMVSEDLYLSLETIKVSYVFRHDGDEDLDGEVIFPLPPIFLSGIQESDFAIPYEKLDNENIVGFTATVDGKKVPVTTDRVAILQPDEPEEGARPTPTPDPAAGYQTPGTDITAVLKTYKIPLSLDYDKVAAALKAAPQAGRDELAKIGAVEIIDGDAYPMWGIIERYHWKQTFPHGKDVKISHEYDAAVPGGIFQWREPVGEEGEYAAALAKEYCIDEGTQKAIKKALRQDEGDKTYWIGSAYYLDYVLKTANTWNGPIGTFKLTIDKGDPGNVISLCVDGIKKTGPTTFVVEKTDFTPKDDLHILVVQKVSD